jgi:hypothetical protein
MEKDKPRPIPTAAEVRESVRRPDAILGDGLVSIDNMGSYPNVTWKYNNENESFSACECQQGAPV